MPAMRCEKHGFIITQFCCRHILAACQANRTAQLFVESAAGGNLNLCRYCHETWLTIPTKDREEQQSPIYYSFFDSLAAACPTCLGEWIEQGGLQI